MTLVIAAGGGVYGVLCADDVRAGREIKIYIIKIKQAARRRAHDANNESSLSAQERKRDAASASLS
jgi:hypothetical protein